MANKDVLDIDEDYILQLISNNVKRFRNIKNISQMKLAEMTGLTHNFIHDIENCKRGVSVRTLAKLSNAFNVEPYIFYLPEGASDNETLIYVKEFNDNIHRFVNDLTQQYIDKKDKSKKKPAAP
ncbi:MAG: helix-turn-helix transcriptional regulator [Treponema sp.]|nr:helix-turn-helix transcriptional regulator [Treponema sp.]